MRVLGLFLLASFLSAQDQVIPPRSVLRTLRPTTITSLRGQSWPDGNSKAAVVFDGADLNRLPAATVVLTLDISSNGGMTWQPISSTTIKGGPRYGDGGVIEKTFGIALTLGRSEPPNPYRRLRVQMVVTGVPAIKTSGKVSFEP